MEHLKSFFESTSNKYKDILNEIEVFIHDIEFDFKIDSVSFGYYSEENREVHTRLPYFPNISNWKDCSDDAIELYNENENKPMIILNP
jgi:hypothetical protein